MKRLEGKVALVFGAGPNIGGTVAHFLGREGAAVLVSDLKKEVAESTSAFLLSKGIESKSLAASALIEADVQKAVGMTIEAYGRVDIVFNAAGKVHWSSVLEMDVTAWSEAVLSFPTAGMLTTKYAARAMIGGDHGGSIIHLLSTAAHFGEAEGAAYCASKAALMNFARSAAMDLAAFGIRVNTITPCAMEHQLWSKMSGELRGEGFKAKPGRPLYSRDDYLKSIPLGRFPRSSDLAAAAVFLASDESSCITGVDLPVDGGLRFKYPVWRPGDHTGTSVLEYAKSLRRTEYGEEREWLFEAPDNGVD